MLYGGFASEREKPRLRSLQSSSSPEIDSDALASKSHELPGLAAIEGPTNFLVEDLRLATKKLGPYQRDSGSRDLILWFCAWGAKVWDPAALDAVVDITRLGYARQGFSASNLKWAPLHKLPNLHDWLASNITPASAGKTFASLGPKDRLETLLRLTKKDLQADLLPILQHDDLRQPSKPAILMAAMAGTGNPKACAEILRAEAEGQLPFKLAARYPIRLSLRSPAPQVANAIRELALCEAPMTSVSGTKSGRRSSRSQGTNNDQKLARSLLVTRLSQLGDTRLFEDFASYETLGILTGGNRANWAAEDDYFAKNLDIHGWFGARIAKGGHGYSESQLALAMARLAQFIRGMHPSAIEETLDRTQLP